MPVTTSVESIGAKRAKEYLERNKEYQRGEKDTNRPISHTVVNNYAVDMLRGNWLLTHQGIAFDTDNWMIDGQHRMLAVILASESGAVDGGELIPANPKLSVRFTVTRGLDRNVFPVLDTGKIRGTGTALAMSGYANSAHLAAAARLIYLYEHYEFKHWRHTKVTNKEILETVKNTGLELYLPAMYSTLKIGLIISPGAAAYYLCERAMPSGPHTEFHEALASGANLASDSPVLVFRNYLIKSKSTDRGTRRNGPVQLALYIKAWNDFVLKRRRTQISWRSNSEPMPEPTTGEK